MKTHKIIYTLVAVFLYVFVASCDDHMLEPDKSIESAISGLNKVETKALPVVPGHYADMGLVEENVASGLTIHYKRARQVDGVTVYPDGTINRENPQIYTLVPLWNDVILHNGEFYTVFSTRCATEWWVFPFLMVHYNSFDIHQHFKQVYAAYERAKGREAGGLRYLMKLHMREVASEGTYLNHHMLATSEITQDTRETYFYTLTADTLELVARTEFPDGDICLNKFDYTVDTTFDVHSADGVFANSEEFMEYLLVEFEKTFGESCEGIAISDLRKEWAEFLELTRTSLENLHRAYPTNYIE